MVLTVLTTTANAIRAWTAEKDYILTGARHTASNGISVISENPTLLAADILTPPAAKLATDIIYVIYSINTSAAIGAGNVPLRIPILGGKTYYVTSNSANAVIQMYLEEVTSL